MPEDNVLELFCTNFIGKQCFDIHSINIQLQISILFYVFQHHCFYVQLLYLSSSLCFLHLYMNSKQNNVGVKNDDHLQVLENMKCSTELTQRSLIIKEKQDSLTILLAGTLILNCDKLGRLLRKHTNIA